MRTKAYYNEFDPKIAAWLRQLISENHLPHGDVDERSIEDVQASDLAGYTQCHFFAGIGGWPLALRLAGVPDNWPVWTGSCPCQPFSAAGKNRGKADNRHLWPAFFNLIKQRNPVAIFGEQVEGAIKHGWLDDLQADLEAEGYAVGAAVLGAHSVGSYHQRQRLFWVAYAGSAGFQERIGIDRVSRKTAGPASRETVIADSFVGDAETVGHERRPATGRQAGDRTEFSGELGSMEFSESEQMGISGQPRKRREAGSGRLPNPESAIVRPIPPAWNEQSNQPNDWLFCRDGKYRPVESGTFPLAHGLPARVVRLRGYGNAIVPQVAAEFVSAALECLHVA